MGYNRIELVQMVRQIFYCYYIFQLISSLSMPRLKPIVEDDSYEPGQPMKYRRYAEKTKKKLWFLVRKLGWSQSAAAKILKMRCSTAKMMLRKYEPKEMEKLGELLRQKYKSKTAPVPNPVVKVQEPPKTEQEEELVYFFVYFDIDPNIFPPPQPEN